MTPFLWSKLICSPASVPLLPQMAAKGSKQCHRSLQQLEFFLNFSILSMISPYLMSFSVRVGVGMSSFFQRTSSVALSTSIRIPLKNLSLNMFEMLSSCSLHDRQQSGEDCRDAPLPEDIKCVDQPLSKYPQKENKSIRLFGPHPCRINISYSWWEQGIRTIYHHATYSCPYPSALILLVGT